MISQRLSGHVLAQKDKIENCAKFGIKNAKSGFGAFYPEMQKNVNATWRFLSLKVKELTFFFTKKKRWSFLSRIWPEFQTWRLFASLTAHSPFTAGLQLTSQKTRLSPKNPMVQKKKNRKFEVGAV